MPGKTRTPATTSPAAKQAAGAFVRPMQDVEIPPPAGTLAAAMTAASDDPGLSPEALVAAGRNLGPVQAPARKYTLGSQADAEDITTPSGETARVRRMGIDGLVRAGIVHSLDQLTKIVQDELITPAQGTSPTGDISGLPDDQQMAAYLEMMHVVDRVCCYCIIEPIVFMTPNDPTTRDPSRVYADQIANSDKFYIFQYAIGGSRDLATFHEEFGDLRGLDSLTHVAL